MSLSALVASVLFIVVVANAGEIDNHRLKCLVCRTAMDETRNVLAKVDPKRNIDIGNYRLDAKGNEIKKTIPMARSAVYISEVLDDICKKLADYVRATYKSNGKLTILSLMLPSGGMNPDISKVDIIQDGDLNKSLEHLCDDVISEAEDDIIKFFQKENVKDTKKVCANVCDGTADSEEDETKDDEDDVTEKTEL